MHPTSMVYIHIIGKWSRRSLWRSVMLPRGQAIGLARGYAKSIPPEFEIVLSALTGSTY